jgi:hypothetical protein
MFNWKSVTCVGVLLGVGVLLTGCPLVMEPRFVSTITRDAASPFEENLIAIAESVYPPREDVLDVFDENLEPPEGDLWWYATFDQTPIPYAITWEAVAYYDALVNSYSQLPNIGGVVAVRSCAFSYTATVEESTMILDERLTAPVYAVKMELSWSLYCGALCGHWFSKERTVILDALGNVLAVFGDGTTPVIIS